jgi:hypothetical protein
MHLKKGSPSLWTRVVKRPIKWLHLCSPMSCSGIHFAQNLWNPIRYWMTPWAELWVMRRCATSSIVTHQLCRIMERNCSMFSSSVVDVDGHPHCSSVILVQPFMNMVTDFYTLHCGKALFSYCAESLGWISAPRTPLAHKNCYHWTLVR